MKLTNTKMKVAKKYQGMIDEIDFEGGESGYWAYSKKGFMFQGMGCHTAHEDSQKELLSMIRTLEPCDCDECKGENKMTNELTKFKRYCELLEITYNMK